MKMNDCIETEKPRQAQRRNGVFKHCHVWAAEDWYGPIPEGKQVNHTCDNPKCYNVNHLYIGTQQENMDDKVRRGRHPRNAPGWPCGEAHPSAKLTAADVVWIREVAGNQPQRVLASLFGVSQSTISKVVRGETWA